MPFEYKRLLRKKREKNAEETPRLEIKIKRRKKGENKV
jgi:hypothetical protein